MKYIKILLVLAASTLLLGCESKPEIPYEVYIHTQEYKDNVVYKNTLEETDYVEKITFEDESKGYSKEYITSLIDSMGDDKGYFYGVYCHRENITQQTCVKSKIKIPLKNKTKEYQNENEDILIMNIEGQVRGSLRNKFNSVKLNEVNIADNNMLIPFSVTNVIALQLLNNGSDILYTLDKTNYGASGYIVK
jgi:hypothetical protein